MSENERKTEPEETAVLIIDMQRDFVEPGAPLEVKGAADTVPVIARFLEFARKKRWRIIHIVRRHKADGSDADMPRRYLFTIGKGYCVENTSGEEIVSVIKEQPGDIKIIKRRFSGFHDTALDATLRVLGVRRVYVTGTQYPNCIRATAVDAMSLDYDTIVVTDCCSAATPEIACSNIRDMQAMGIRCENSQDIKSQYQ